VIFWVWLLPYLLAFGAGFAFALLIKPIRRAWEAWYDRDVDPPEVLIPLLRNKVRERK